LGNCAKGADAPLQDVSRREFVSSLHATVGRHQVNITRVHCESYGKKNNQYNRDSDITQSSLFSIPSGKLVSHGSGHDCQLESLHGLQPTRPIAGL